MVWSRVEVCRDWVRLRIWLRVDENYFVFSSWFKMKLFGFGSGWKWSMKHVCITTVIKYNKIDIISCDFNYIVRVFLTLVQFFETNELCKIIICKKLYVKTICLKIICKNYVRYKCKIIFIILKNRKFRRTSLWM